METEEKKKPQPTPSQKEAIGSRKKRVIVTASAGAGKTSTMIERVLDLIKRDRVSLLSIVMLTFTQTAAEEMKTRLSLALFKEIPKAEDKETRDALVKALEVLPMFHCSTIDSFCYTLVKTHFELLGLSPKSTLMEEEEQIVYRKKAARQLLQEFFESNAEEYFKLLNWFGKEDALIEAIENLYKFAETTEDGDAFLQRAEAIARQVVRGEEEETPAMQDYHRWVTKQAKEAYDKAFEEGVVLTSAHGKYFENKNKILNCLDSHISGKSVADYVNARTGVVIKEPKDKDAYDIVVTDAFAKMHEIFNAFKNTMGDGFSKNKYDANREVMKEENQKAILLIGLTKRFKTIYSSLKEAALKMDFMEVEHGALVLLDQYGVAEKIGCRYLLVDECQDLNPLQDTLMRLIVGEKNLFMVGDVKQSIFRFRLSDPLIFQRRIASAKENSEEAVVIDFSENFRSSDAVVNYVNTVFAKLMTEEFGGVTYLPATRGDRHTGSGNVTSYFYTQPAPPEPTCDKVYSVKEAAEALSVTSCKEGIWVKNRILELVGQPYIDTKDGSQKILSYKDIAILSSKRMASGNRQEQIIETLRRAGIPVNVGTFVRDKEYGEIRAVADFLTLIESPNNDYALLSVLRSDMFGFSLKRIAEISFREGKTFAEKAKAGAEAGETDLKAFFDYTDEMRALSGALSPYEFVSKLIDEKMRLPVLKRVDGRKVFGEILGFAETLRSASVRSVSEFIDWFRNEYKVREGAEVAESDAVNVMSIHKSKGLEFPVVFVVAMDDAILPSDSKDKVFSDKEYGVVVKKTGEKTLYDAQFKRKKNQEITEDKLRLLYVALTRAKNYLYLSGQVPEEEPIEGAQEQGAQPLPPRVKTDYAKEEAKTLAQWILCATKDTPYSFQSEDPEEEVFLSDAQEPPKPDPDEVARLQNAFSRKYPHENATKTGIKFTVTAINQREREAFDPTEQAVPLFRGEERMKGTAFHAAMEYLPFTLADEEETSLLLDKAVADGALEQEERDALSPKAVFEAIKGVRALIGEETVYREKSFLLRLPAPFVEDGTDGDEVLVQGKIDLLAVKEEQAILVDYKLSGAPAEVLKERYRKQLELYAEAVQKGFGVSKVSSYIFVLGRNQIIAVD